MKTSWKIACVFVLLGIGVYANTLSYPFVHDDVVFIRNNPRISDLDHLSALFGRKAVAPENLPLANPYYRPLLEIFYRLEYRAFGFHPAGYHLCNILVHIANTILIFFLLRHCCLRKELATGIAAIFLLHPVQTETVACISGISNLLAAFFCLGSLLLYVTLTRATYLKHPRDFLLSLAVGLFYALALFVKEQAIILPLLVLLYERCWGRGQARTSFTNKLSAIILGVVTLGYFVLRKIVLGGFLVPLFHYPHELWLRISAIPATIVMDLGVLVFPRDLHYYRSIDTLAVPGTANWLFLIMVIGTLAFLRSCRRKTSREFLACAYFAVGWFVITLLPTLNIFPLINEYSFIAAFEHFLYLPLLGLLLGLGIIYDLVSAHVEEKKRQALHVFLFTALIVTCGSLTIRQNTFWRGEIPLFERVKTFEPRLGRIRILLGRAYYFNRQYDRAIGEYQEAITIMQGYLRKAFGGTAQTVYRQFLRESYSDMAHCYDAKGDIHQAIEQYQEALHLAPDDEELNNNMGVSFMKIGDIENARGYFQKVTLLYPQNVMARTNLSVCLIERGEYQQAEQLLQAVLVQHPDFQPARQNLEKLRAERKLK